MPTTTNRYYDLQEQIAALETEKRKAADAERVRLAVENANQDKIAQADRQLADLRRQAAAEQYKMQRAEVDAAVARDRAAVEALQITLRELVDVIAGAMTTPLADAERAYTRATEAINEAMATGAQVADLAQVRSAMPAPLLPFQAALIGESAETNPLRRRIWQALGYVMHGEVVSANADYDADAQARQREKDRTRRYVMPKAWQ